MIYHCPLGALIASAAHPPSVIRFGAFELDAANEEVRKFGVSLKLHPQPFRVLLLLVTKPGQIVAREEIQHSLWGNNTFVDFEAGTNFCIKQIRDTLGDDADKPKYIETIPRRGYRFIAPVSHANLWERVISFPLAPDSSDPASPSVKGSIEASMSPDLHPVLASTLPAPRLGFEKSLVIAAAGALLLVTALASAAIFYLHRPTKLTEKDSIVLADFTNTTGDAVFDGTLRQGLEVQLEQSPFLNIISDQQAQQTLQMMDQKPDVKLTPEIARELCQRTGSKAYLSGSLTSLGSQYVLGIKAVNCLTGDTLAEEQVRATGKEQVLSAMDKAVPKLRTKLGESLSAVERLDIPIEQATTPSLEALQAYSLGWAMKGVDNAAAAAIFQRAIRLDPEFAMAYASLGQSYSNLGKDGLAAKNTRKAYELRQRVSEREKFYIESHYYDHVSGDLEKARQVFELWEMTYPRDGVPPASLGIIYVQLGQYDKALVENLKSLRLSRGALNYARLAFSYLYLGRLQETQATADEALAKKLDSAALHESLYQLAFLQNDEAGMAKQVAWAAGKPSVEDSFLSYEADTAAYSGRLGKSREFSRRAATSSDRAGEKEVAAGYKANAALREGLFGNSAEARQQATSALEFSTGQWQYVQCRAAWALALAGDSGRPQALAVDLAKRFPENTIVQFKCLPILQAQFALNRNDAAKAIEALQAAAPTERGIGDQYPAFLRGEAYLRERQGELAAGEFQRILNSPGLVISEPIGALAHLGLARAYALQGDTAKAKAAYQDFLALWKDADPNIPILIAAKAEYAKLN